MDSFSEMIFSLREGSSQQAKQALQQNIPYAWEHQSWKSSH